MSKFLVLAYWFNSRPEPLSGDQRKLLIEAAAILILLGIICTTGILHRYTKIQKKPLSKITWFSYTNALIALSLLFFNYELTPYLRSYIWYLIWLVLNIVWVISIIRSFSPKAHGHAKPTEREKEIKKYLP